MNKKSCRFLQNVVMRSRKRASLNECKTIDRLAKLYGENKISEYNQAVMQLHAADGSAIIVE